MTATPPEGNTRHIPSLDGLRAAAISLVLLNHGGHGLPLPAGAVERAWLVFDQGVSGVMIFFAVSGYLITLLLRRERERTGRIDLGAFYVRRVLRIFPAFYSFVAVVFLLTKAGLVDLSGVDFGITAFYAWNFRSLAAYFLPGWFAGSAHAGVWYVGHTWTLALEEQFYLCWPLLFGLVGPRRGILVAIGILALSPLVRVGSYLLFPSLRLFTSALPLFATDPIIFGVLAALLEGHPVYERWLAHLSSRWLPAVAAFFLFLVSPWLRRMLGGFYALGFAPTLDAAAIVLAVLWLVRHPQTTVGRWFNRPKVAAVGVFSYSLYLWQQIFLFPRSDTAWNVQRFPWNFLCCGAAAVGSYFLIEQPFLRWKQRFARVPPELIVHHDRP